MSKASATATLARTRPALIEGAWNDISILSMLGFGSVLSLVAKADEVEIRLDILPDQITPRFFCDEEDLDLLIGPDQARKARDCLPAWGSVKPADRGKLGLAEDAVDEEILALCARRGVPVDGDQVDRTTLEKLGQLLKRESRFPEGEYDAVMGNTIWAGVRAVIRTPVPEDEPEQPKPKPWFNPDPFFRKPESPEVNQPGRANFERYDRDYQIKEQCRILGIRSIKNKFTSNRAFFLGFDAYRLAGVKSGLKSYGRPHEPGYQELMTRAYDEVFERE